MKNLYALNYQGNLINISDVDKSKSEKYYCLQCGDEMISRKGYVNRHHFSHKSIKNCSFETYLHKLSKNLFYNKYNYSLVSKKPFYIEYSLNRICNSCSDLKIECKINEEFHKFDLTKKFDEIYIEKSHNGFIPDILLKSSKTNEVIFVEFAVTHNCEISKIKSGIRIIELDIKKEQDLDFLFNDELVVDNSNFNYFNFNFKTDKSNYIERNYCRNKFSTFIIYKNGDAHVNNSEMSEIRSEKENEELIYYELSKEINVFNNSNYINKIKEASKKGVDVRNCHACKYCIKNNNPYSIFPFFCDNLDKDIIQSNDGTTCNQFKRFF